MKADSFYIIKRISIHIIGCVLCALQAYISMYEYRDITSAALKWSYAEDILFGTLFFYLFFLFLFALLLCILFLWKAKKRIRICKLILIPVIYAAACYMVNYIIFVSREASWGTFSEPATVTGIVQESYIAMLITTVIFYFLNKFLLHFDAR